MIQHTSWAGRCCIALAAMLTSVFSAGCPGEESPDIAAIRQAWTRIDQANQGADGETAASLFTAASIARYSKITDAALHAKRADLDKLDDWDLWEVFRIRLRAKASEIEGLGPREYVVFATSKGWYRSDEDVKTELGRVNITGDTATATEVLEGEKSSYLLKFFKEEGVWKYDEDSWRGPFNQEVRDMAGTDRQERALYILDLLAEETGKDIPDSVWQPMINPVGAFNPGG